MCNFHLKLFLFVIKNTCILETNVKTKIKSVFLVDGNCNVSAAIICFREKKTSKIKTCILMSSFDQNRIDVHISILDLFEHGQQTYVHLHNI